MSSQLNQLHAAIGVRLVEIELLFEKFGVAMPLITLVARNPASDKMVLILSNDPDPKLTVDIALRESVVQPPVTADDLASAIFAT